MWPYVGLATRLSQLPLCSFAWQRVVRFSTQPEGQERITKLSAVIQAVVSFGKYDAKCTLQVSAENQQFRVVGHALPVFPGEQVMVSGQWKNDAKFGKVLMNSFVEVDELPASVADMRAFIKSPAFERVSTPARDKLLDKYQGNLLTALDTHDYLLYTVPSVQRNSIVKMLRTWREMKLRRSVTKLLVDRGFAPDMAIRVCEKLLYSMHSPLETLSENPYILLSLPNTMLEWPHIEQLAAPLKMKVDDPRRISGGLLFSLNAAMRNGNCGLPVDTLLSEATQLLGVPVTEDHLAQGVVAKHVRIDAIDETRCAFTDAQFRLEDQIANNIFDTLHSRPTWLEQVSLESLVELVPRFEKELGFTLSRSQVEGLKVLMGSKVSVLTGGPGVGKTLLLKMLVSILESKGVRPILCAPTGFAAQRMQTLINRPAKTIHSLIGLTPEDSTTTPTLKLLDGDLLIVDECSMVDVSLMAALTSCAPANCAMLFVGDSDQLPSIGPGNCLADMINSGLPLVRLTEIHRQKEGSSIILAAHAINSGRMPEYGDLASDFAILPCEEERIPDVIVDLVANKLPAMQFDPIKEVQVITSTNKIPRVGTTALNHSLQAAVKRFRPASFAHSVVESSNYKFYKGDKVMNILNDYMKNVFNGESGIIEAINYKRSTHEAVTVAFGNDRKVPYTHAELVTGLSLSYAITVHKSQGTEFPVVIIPLSWSQADVSYRSLYYTAITRARHKVILVGDPEVLQFGANFAGRSVNRWSRLGPLLVAAIQDAPSLGP